MSAECFACGADLVYVGFQDMECPICTRDERAAEMRQIGDQLQSEASRMAEFINEHERRLTIPYEVRSAAIGVQNAIAAWTRLRKAEHR